MHVFCQGLSDKEQAGVIGHELFHIVQPTKPINPFGEVGLLPTKSQRQRRTRG